MSRVIVDGRLSGSLSSVGTLNGTLSSNATLSGGLTVPRSTSGANDYERLKNKPSIESVELTGDKTFEELGLASIDNTELMELLTF